MTTAIKKFITDQSEENKFLWCVQPQMGHTAPARFRNHYGIGGGKIVRARGLQGLEQISILKA